MKVPTQHFSKRAYNRSIKYVSDAINKGMKIESGVRIIGEIYGAQWGKVAKKDIKHALNDIRRVKA